MTLSRPRPTPPAITPTSVRAVAHGSATEEYVPRDRPDGGDPGGLAIPGSALFRAAKTAGDGCRCARGHRRARTTWNRTGTGPGGSDREAARRSAGREPTHSHRHASPQ